jgi:paraquat-inducible protein B
VALDFFPKAPPAKIDLTKNPIELPTVPNSLDEIQSQVQEIATKLNKVPYEQIAADLRTTLATLNKTLDHRRADRQPHQQRRDARTGRRHEGRAQDRQHGRAHAGRRFAAAAGHAPDAAAN